MLMIFAVKFEKWIFGIFLFMMADPSRSLRMTINVSLIMKP